MVRFFDAKKRNLLYALVAADFKIRYQNSVLGYLWSLVRPLSLFTVLYIVFVRFFQVGSDIPHFAVYLLLGIMMWNFFAEATNNGLSSFIDKADMIRKVNTPRYAIVVAAVSSSAVNLFINLLVVFIFALINQVPIDFIKIWILPLAIVELIILATAASFLLASLYVRFRDIKYIWELLLQIGFYATPIIYPISKIPEQYQPILMINPMAQIVQGARFALIGGETPTAISILHQYFFIPYLLLLLLIVVSLWYFKTKNRFLAEEL